ncbi:hypothetical protein [Pseudoclavibacter soli]|uniref:hypothetical protein n=1 Tax=Pseudoclavibacter soli TaxID=452623 RepID=UPI00040BEF62|nr:hypothetical protein [Pseudoclavibacter soli]
MNIDDRRLIDALAQSRWQQGAGSPANAGTASARNTGAATSSRGVGRSSGSFLRTTHLTRTSPVSISL